MVKLWQNERSKPHPDLTIKVHMEEKTEVFKRVASEAKDRQWKSFSDTLNRGTTLTHFWQFYIQMEGCTANTSTPDLIGTSGAVLKTSKEKGSALLQRFVQQSNQNNLDERKAVWKGLDRTLTEAGSNDDLITELEFTEALSGLSKDTAPSPYRVKYLSVDNKSELFRLYEESFATGQVPEDWSHSYLKPIPKPGKDHGKLNGYRILTLQNTTGKLMERIVAIKLAQDLERRNVLPPNQGGYQAGKTTWENAARFAYDVFEGFQRKEQTLAVAVDLEDAYNGVQFKLLMELLVQYGVSVTLTRWLAAALQERKVAMRLGNWISTPQQLTMGLPQGSPLSPVVCNVYTKGLVDMNSNGLSRVLTLQDGGLIYKTASDISTAVTAVQGQLEKMSHWCQETESKINPSKAQQSSKTSNASSLLQWRSHRTHEQSQIPRDPLRQNVYVQDAGRINKNQVQERHGFKGHRAKSSVPDISKCDTQRHWLWSGSHNPVTVQPAQARQGAKRSHESHSGNNKGHTHGDHALPTGPAFHGNKT